MSSLLYVKPEKDVLKEIQAGVDQWCVLNGRSVDDYCNEHDHLWLAVEGWPPRRECLVCGLVEERPEPEPLFAATTCGVCGQGCIKDVLSPMSHEGENVWACPGCIKKKNIQILREGRKDGTVVERPLVVIGKVEEIHPDGTTTTLYEEGE